MKENFFQIIISDSDKDITPPNYANVINSFNNIEYSLLNFRKVSKILKDSSYTGLYESFQKLKPYAFKSDLARYYLLYEYGGWYSDINNYFVKNSEGIIKNDLVLFSDIAELTGGMASFANGLIYSKKKNPIFKKAIDMIIGNCLKENYGSHPLEVSGPILLANAISVLNKDLDKTGKFDYVCIEEQTKKAFFWENQIVAEYKPNGENPGNSGLIGGNDYAKMWHDGEVFY